MAISPGVPATYHTVYISKVHYNDFGNMPRAVWATYVLHQLQPSVTNFPRICSMKIVTEEMMTEPAAFAVSKYEDVEAMDNMHWQASLSASFPYL
jgi:hypothetical protein